MRVVLDTNVLVSRFLSPLGNPAAIFQSFQDEVFELILSEPILAEFQEVMRYNRLRRLHGLTDAEIAVAAEDFAEFATMIEPTEPLSVVLDDPEDDKFFEAAVTGQAEVIVSGDHHLLELRTYRGIRVVTPAAFLAILRQDKTGDP